MVDTTNSATGGTTMDTSTAMGSMTVADPTTTATAGTTMLQDVGDGSSGGLVVTLHLQSQVL
jgi:hypothetical protein